MRGLDTGIFNNVGVVACRGAGAAAGADVGAGARTGTDRLA